jgi:preprotein translocase subunit SecE
MAKAAENTNKSVKPAAGNRFTNFFKGIGKSFKNMYHELKKVTWPTKKELLNYSVVVFVFLIVMGVIIGVIDTGAGALVNLIVKL